MEEEESVERVLEGSQCNDTEEMAKAEPLKESFVLYFIESDFIGEKGGGGGDGQAGRQAGRGLVPCRKPNSKWWRMVPAKWNVILFSGAWVTITAPCMWHI